MAKICQTDQTSRRCLVPARDSILRHCGSLLLLVLSLALPAGAQSNDLYFDALTPAGGLPSGQVQEILQDRSGFIWFGIQSGLVRYDGQALTVYKHDLDDPRTLADNNVTALCEDRQGNIWVGTHVGGLSRFDRATGAFTRFQHDAKTGSIGEGAIWSICEDRAGTLWVSLTGGGLARFDRASETFTHFLPQPDSPRSRLNYLVEVYEDQRGNLWVGSASGLLRFDRDSNQFTLFNPDPQKPDFTHHFYEDQAGTLWVSSYRGLLRFERETGSFTRFAHDARKPDTLSSDRVRAIEEDSAGRLWVGTEDGLNRFEPETGRFIRYTNDAATASSLLDNLVTSLYRDRAGSLWIGSAGGVNHINRGYERFTRYRFQANNPRGLSDKNVSQIYEDRDRFIWVGTWGGGLNKLDRKTGEFEHFRHDPRNPRSLSSNNVQAICQDRTGALWVGTQGGGLNLLDRRTGIFTRYRSDPNNPASLSHDSVQSIYEDSAGTLWVGTLGGLNQFDRERRQFIRFLHDPANPHSLSNNRVIAIFEARDGTFWVATDGGGLSRLDRQNGQFTAFKHDPDDPASLSSNAVISLAEDATGALWVATFGGGLNKFEPATASFTRYTEKDGLASDSVWGVLVDRAGVLWLNTSKAVSRFDPRTGKFLRYTVSDGLAAETGDQNGHAKTRAGELIFGGGQGFTIFDPRQLTDEPLPPPIALTVFKKFDQIVNFGRDLTEVAEIELAQRENFFSFEFAALDYKEPERNQYAYKLEGFDADWIYCGTRRYASYTNLDAGQYLFRVKGANRDGVWNQEGVAINIRITPPFWKTQWFVSLIIVSLGGLAFFLYQYRVSRLKREYAAKEAFSRQLIESQETERKRIASELHDSLGQNLLVIKNRALLGQALATESGSKEQFDEITTSVTEALSEVRTIAYNLRPLHLERLGLTSTIEEMVEMVAGASLIRITADVAPLEGLFAKEAEINLYRIVQECLNNIVKHSQATEASVTMYRDRELISLTVEDNGRGFDTHSPTPPDTDGKARRGGLGLTGIAERVRMLGGTHRIASAPHQGTVVTVEIPIPRPQL
jgi:signal transduction histidine kinase/ligand-binding sensor domain-containing protein